MNWQPTASRETLVLRARILATIREFFAAANVLEVDTPVIGHAGAGDPALKSIAVTLNGQVLYLQTSPESAMKRLLAAGSGDIYQLGKAFRDDEQSRLHRPEFTLLEWYRLGYDHHRLMDEVAALVAKVLPQVSLSRASFASLCDRCGAPDPHLADTGVLADYAAAHGLRLSVAETTDRCLLLDFLMSEVLRDAWPPGTGGFVYEFPVEQAAYASLLPGPPAVAARFELVIDGIEIANGWQELCDPELQRERYLVEAGLRQQRGLPPMPADARLLAGLAHGLPACAGVALGVDRLVLLAAAAEDLSEVLAFGADIS